MFGIGGGELVFIMFVALMLFGTDKIPEIARNLGKIMAQLKNATNDIKSEIQKGAQANGLDKTFEELHGNFTGLTQDIETEVNKAKTQMLTETASTQAEVAQSLEDIQEGPIKRQK